MTVRPYIRPSVRPSVRTTELPIHFLHWIESCAESRVFSARNRMLTRVVAKQAKTTKVKNKFVSGKKKFKRTLSCLFGGRGKVQSRRKKFGDKVQAKSSNLPRRFCSNLVGTPLEFAAFRCGFDAKYSRASAFWFFLSTTMVFTAFRTHFARKNTSIFILMHTCHEERNKY